MSKSFSVFTAFKAKDGLTPAFKSMIKNSSALTNNIARTRGTLNQFGLCVQGTCKTFSALGKTFIAGFVLDKAQDAIKKTTEAAEKQLAVEQKLTQALKNNAAIRSQGSGAYLKKSQELFGFASKLQQKGIIGDEVLIGGMQSLASMGFDDKVIKRMTPIIADLAVQQKGYNVTIEDAEQISKQLGRALAGNAGGLSRMGVVLSAVQQKQIKNMQPLQRANFLYKLLAQRVGGLNEKFAQTDRGAKIQALNNLGDKMEDIGKKILPIEGVFWRFVNKNMPAISSGIDKFFKGFNFAFKSFKPVFDELRITFNILSNDLNKTMSRNIPIFKTIFSGIVIPALVVAIASFNKFYEILSNTFNFISDNWIPIVSIMAGVGGMLALKKAFDLVSSAVAWYNTTLMISTTQGVAALSGFTKLKFMMSSYTAVVIQSTKALLKQSWALISSPWGIVAAGLTLIVAGAILVWKNWDRITAALKTFWAKCTEIFSAFKTFFKDNFINIILGALGPIGLIINGIRSIGGAVRNIGNKSANANTSPRVNQTPQANYNQGGLNQFSGNIGVDVNINNSTMFPLSSKLDLIGGHGLNLNPA